MKMPVNLDSANTSVHSLSVDPWRTGDSVNTALEINFQTRISLKKKYILLNHFWMSPQKLHKNKTGNIFLIFHSFSIDYFQLFVKPWVFWSCRPVKWHSLSDKRCYYYPLNGVLCEIVECCFHAKEFKNWYFGLLVNPKCHYLKRKLMERTFC